MYKLYKTLLVFLLIASHVHAQEKESSAIIKEVMQKNLSMVFNEHNMAARKKAISELYTKNPVLLDPIDHVMVGRDSINSQVNTVLEMYAGFVFTQAGKIKVDNEVARMGWNFGPPGNPPVQTGVMIAVFSSGKIQSLTIIVFRKKERD